MSSSDPRNQIEGLINAIRTTPTPSLITKPTDIEAIRKGILRGLKALMDDQDDERPIECKVDEAVVVELKSRWAQVNGMWK